ncbi:hypothetical protein GG344DRAFT_60773 [Lentinula edodes]|nr:hypothetical protein GG344DRAFT_60773 [Lentinula edodes]
MIKRKDKSKKVAGVLGKATLAEVRTDMERLRLPSWAPTAPSNPGDTTHGKFTADQWRAFCTVNLPITLIRLWGSLPEENRKFKMLENFMFLVMAVRLANMRTITEGQIQDFEQNIRAYLEQLRILYPHTNITVYQHMMLHFGSLLRRFGPVHSWRCFPFERYNYILQNTPNNSHLGISSHYWFRMFTESFFACRRARNDPLHPILQCAKTEICIECRQTSSIS